MKKVILSLFAVAALASCVQTEELGVANNKEAIGFDTFVDNTTKGDLYTTANLEAFKVYGTISQNGAVVTNIFDDVTVTKNGSAWTYDSQYTQYWIPGFRYDFAAVVDGDVVKNSHNMPESIEVDMTEQKDVLYATAGRDFGANDVATKVGFTFNHLLAKAKFTVKNTIVNGKDFVYNIESIKIKNADKNGAYDVATGVWAANDTYCADFGVVATLAMGSQPVSGADVLLLPSNNKDLDIEVEYKLTYKGATLKSETKTLNAVLTLEKGKAYNFIVEFGNPGEEIEFEAVVDGWETGNLSDYILEADGFGKDVVNTGIYHIQNLAGLEYFAAQVNGGRSFEGQTVVLDTDIDLATRAGSEWTPIGADSSKYFEGTFDGQDHTISNFQVNREGHAGLFGYARATFKNLSVENVTLVAHHYAGGIVGQGYVKIDSCHAKNVNITLSTKDNDWGDKAGGIVGQLCEGATLGIQNSTVNNVTIKGYRDLGGVAGMAHNNNFVKNCSATNVTLIQDLSDDYQSTTPTTLGAVVGRFGSNVVYEGCTGEATTYKYAANQDGFVSALALGGDILLAAGEYDFPASGVYAGEVKVLPEALVVRSGAGVVVNLLQSTYIPGTTLTLEGVTFKVPAGLTYNESAFAFIHHAAKFNMNNCVIDGGRLRLNVKEANIDQCQFNVTTSSGFDGYGLFYYGPSNSQVNVSNSTFTTCGKAIVLYNEGPCELNLKVEGCEFTSSNPDTDKAAISVHSEGGIHGNLDIVNSTATGFANHNDGLWRDVNNSTGKDNNKFTVEVNEDVVMVEGATVVNTWAEFTAALASGATNIVLKSDITYDKVYTLSKNVTIYLAGKSLEISTPELYLGLSSAVTIKNGTIKGKVYALKNSNVTFDGVTFGGSINAGGSSEGLLQIQGGCNVYAKDCTFSATNSNSKKARPLSIQSTSSGSYEFVNCLFKTNSNQNQVYVNPLGGTATLTFTGCSFKATLGNKAANIEMGGSYSLANLNLTNNVGGFTFTLSRASTDLTEADKAILYAIKANNSGSMRFIFTDGEKSNF